MKSILVLVGVLTGLYASARLDTPLHCAAQLPDGPISFDLVQRSETLWLELPDGTRRSLQIDQGLSEPGSLVAAMPGTSIVLEDSKHFTQTFLSSDGPPAFIYGECGE